MQEVLLLIQPQQLDVDSASNNYIRADLMEAELITLTQVIKDIKTIDKVFTDYSQTFNLPASKTNNKLFKHWFNADVVGFDNNILSPARIELNHMPFKEGRIMLDEVVMRHNKPAIYRVTFFGNTLSFKAILGDSLLQDLNWLNNFNHNNTDAIVKQGLESGIDFTFDSTTYSNGIIYPLISHTHKYVYSSNSSDVNNINRSPSQAPDNHGRRGIFKEDLKPAILVKNIFKAIEQTYNIEFKTGEFLDSTPLDNLYLWLHRNKGKMLTGGTWLGINDAYGCEGDCSAFEVGAEGTNYFDLSKGVYTYGSTSLFAPQITKDEALVTLEITPYTGYTNVFYDFELTDLAQGLSFAKKTNQQGTQTIESYFSIGGQGFDFRDHVVNNWPAIFNPITGSNVSLFATYFLKIIGKLNVEETFAFQAKFTITRTVIIENDAFDPPIVTTVTNTANFTSTSAQIGPTDGLTVITDQLPKMKIIDFVNSIFKMFNLTTFVNEDGLIVVRTMDDYYGGGEVLDLTQYVNTDEHKIGENLPYSKIDLEYSNSVTILADEFKNLFNRKFGELEYTSNTLSGKEYKITVPLEHMMFERIKAEGATAYSEFQQGTFVDKNNEPTIGKPLLFYGNYRSDLSSLYYSVNFVYNTRPTDGSLPTTSGSNFGIKTHWMPNNASEIGNSTTPAAFNLNFGSEINEFRLTDYGGNTNSLFQKFYENYIQRIFTEKVRLYKFSAVLPLKVLLKISLDDKIIIGTRAYTINKMTTRLQSGKTELELINEPN